MAARLIDGHTTWSLQRDSEWNRNYKIKFLVECDSTDGPHTALECIGLPRYGDTWNVDGDVDNGAWCRPDATVTPTVENEANKQFSVEMVFSSKLPTSKNCKDSPIDNPLLEPPKVSGSDATYQEEAQFDRFGRPICSSSWEMIRGPQVEFDKSRGHIKITMNVASFDTVALAYSMRDTVNDAPLWGFKRRCVKLTKTPWDRKYFGICFPYYELTLEFDTNPKTFDRDIMDVGNQVLKGHWDRATGAWVLDNIGLPPNDKPPNRMNPQHFIRYQDPYGNQKLAVLNGKGLPAGVVSGSGKMFISIVASNTDNPVSDTNFWIPIGDPLAPGSEADALWEGDVTGDLTSYEIGDIVRVAGSDPGTDRWYVAIEDNIDEVPLSNGGGSWVFLGLGNVGPFPNVPYQFKGKYNTATNYAVGDYVRDSTFTTAAVRHVEKYDESDFLLLGIPIVL